MGTQKEDQVFTKWKFWEIIFERKNNVIYNEIKKDTLIKMSVTHEVHTMC